MDLKRCETDEDADEAFRKFIVVDMESDEDKENTTNTSTRTKHQQFVVLEAFMKDNNEQVMDKNVYNDKWNDLTVELNNLGPPFHSAQKWKKIWSYHKYNKRRRIQSSTHSPGTTSQYDPQSSNNIAVQGVQNVVEPSSSSHFTSENQPSRNIAIHIIQNVVSESSSDRAQSNDQQSCPSEASGNIVVQDIDKAVAQCCNYCQLLVQLDKILQELREMKSKLCSLCETSKNP